MVKTIFCPTCNKPRVVEDDHSLDHYECALCQSIETNPAREAPPIDDPIECPNCGSRDFLVRAMTDIYYTLTNDGNGYMYVSHNSYSNPARVDPADLDQDRRAFLCAHCESTDVPPFEFDW